MKKLLFFGSLFMMLFSVSSCVDPNTVAIANGTANAGITGPRILESVDFGNQNWAYYNSSNGVVNSFDEKYYNPVNNSILYKRTYTFTYNNSKISKFQVDIFDAGSLPGDAKKIVVVPIYNTSGSIISFTTNYFDANNVNIARDLGEFTYNSSGKPTKIFTKIGHLVVSNGTFSYQQATTTTATYTGENIFKIENSFGTYDSVTGALINDPAMSTLIENSLFDSQLTPYSTFSKDLKACLSIIRFEKIDYFSANNHLKEKTTNGTNAPVENQASYQYDNQGYPVLLNSTIKYTYKTL